MNRRGQALLELAIFGSLILVLLGLLLNYGMNTDGNQQVMMRSFRRAMNLAAGPGNAAAVIVKDNYIPSPTDPFATSSMFPSSAGANVTRTFQLGKPISSIDQLPKMELEVNGTTRTLTTGAAPFICEGDLLDLNMLIAECKKDSSPWCCQKLPELFAASGVMGLQPNTLRSTQTSTTIQKDESPTAISTTSTFNRQEAITREIITRQPGDTSGATVTETVASQKNDNTTTTWETPW